jgi:hypothetical protein
MLFTEHALETRNNDDERETANNEDKSFILAPFNSLDELFMDNNQPLMEQRKDMPPFKWPREVIQMVMPRKTIKFSSKCREKNRIYE